MRLKELIDEDFVNYKKPVMYIGTIFCSGKCCREANIPLSVCQNYEWNNSPIIDIDTRDIIERYLNNSITSGICFGGLEPFQQFGELLDFIHRFRTEYQCNDIIIIYTGFYKNEIPYMINKLKRYSNIVVKFGRFIPDDKKRYDPILGIYLSSQNQYAEIISEEQI